MLMAPLHDLAAIDVPGQVDDHVAGGDVLGEQRSHVVLLNAILDKRHPLLEPGTQSRLVRLEVHDGNLSRRNLHVLEKDGQRASRHRTKPNKENTPVELEHEITRLVLAVAGVGTPTPVSRAAGAAPGSEYRPRPPL